jgi:hypothetical protein
MMRERENLEDLGVDGRIILKMDLQGVGWGIDLIDLAQGRDTRWAVVYAVMNFRVV